MSRRPYADPHECEACGYRTDQLHLTHIPVALDSMFLMVAYCEPCAARAARLTTPARKPESQKAR